MAHALGLPAFQERPIIQTRLTEFRKMLGFMAGDTLEVIQTGDFVRHAIWGHLGSKHFLTGVQAASRYDRRVYRTLIPTYNINTWKKNNYPFALETTMAPHVQRSMGSFTRTATLCRAEFGITVAYKKEQVPLATTYSKLLKSMIMQLRDVLPLALLCSHFVSAAKFFQNWEDAPQDTNYDFIIVGGGIGGGVVAARLAENPRWKVLLIEAGPSNEDVFATHVPGLTGQLVGTFVDYNYTTVSSPSGMSERYPRGPLDGMVYTRGSRDDWDSWAKIVEDDGLKWDNIMPFMLKAERLVEDSENQSERGHLDPSLHGTHGKLFVTSGFVVHPFNEMLIQATKEMPDEFPFLLDMNDGRPIGVSWNQLTIDHKGERSSSATAYVETSSDNLHVLLNSYVTRVLPVGKGTDFRGVEFAANAQSKRSRLVAKKEVIVAGGVIGTPQILMNSGIGDRAELEAVGVKTLVDNPSVGKNFTDQVYTLSMFNTTLQDTDFEMNAALAEWNASRTGLLALPVHLRNHIAWIRLPEDAPPFQADGFNDPSPGQNAPHIELYASQISTTTPVTNGQVPTPPSFGDLLTLQLQIVNLHPASRGSITLASSDPFAHPLINPKLLSNPVDIAIMREAHRSTRKLLSAPVFKDSVFESLYPASNVTSDDELDAFITSAAGSYLHGGGSAKMSPHNASWGVVDPDYRVKGTMGLRIVDASILPNLPSGHTQAPVYAHAERASNLISSSWF
ncbi:hypothetical protein NP233_g11591 [Leucocoprinus birnbaumii]|uniref:pyranose dehydrogenase (acceptor) n=1 Tax=Leucocoprinus birnbaumii TaxID=56174 RepID=A0AAD5YNT7_9AGAR|nr:hypothetical protein NP233_g11591 [Leucocoprinus birnbaumii]